MKKEIRCKINKKDNKIDVGASIMSARGITLISLVITIIILIILAGVGINLSLGENGIFRRAKEARDKYLTAEEREKQQLNELYAQLNENDLPENTSETQAGTEVKMPSKWYTTTWKRISTPDGNVVKKQDISSTVYAVADGKGNTIPVPEGFYYVGGNIETGVVISDNSQDGYETTKRDMTSHEDAPKLKGNQFVWIPCNKNDYKKINWGKQDSSITWDMETRVSEAKQVEKYGGFYIGRYEAGVATLDEEKNEFVDSVTFKNGKSLYKEAVAIQSGYNSWGWQNYDYTARQTGSAVTIGSDNVESGNVSIKANSIPYYHADYYTAVEMSRRLYSGKAHVKSELVTGTQWDMMCKYMQDKGVDVKGQKSETSKWGNYTDTSLTGLRGYYAKVGSGGATEKFVEVPKTEGTTSASLKSNYILLTTGSTQQVKKMNLYDVAGNLWEWTQEAAYLDNLKYTTDDTLNTYVLRGGSIVDGGTSRPACWRDYKNVARTNSHLGFRVALYLE